MLQSFLPAAGWLKSYNRQELKADLGAGVMIAFLLIPQGMAYAMLAGLPPVMGLYASTLPLMLYALFGSSRHLAVGPVAMISLLVLTGVSPLAEPGSDRYIQLVLLLSFLIGILQCLLGLLKAGFFIHFVSHAVMSGFSSAAAITIAVSQLGHLLGIKLPVHPSPFGMVWEAIGRVGETHLLTCFIGVGSVLLLILLKKYAPKFPAPLLLVAGSILISYLIRLDLHGVRVVGVVPTGLPKWRPPEISLESLRLLFPVALTILFVGYMESISIAKLIAIKERYKIEPDQELRGLGLANLAASLFSGYPVTGGFSRTAVNHQAGARTGLASLITAGLILLTLLFFAPLFYHLPNAVLAGIVLVAVSGLMDFQKARHFFKIRPVDGWTWVFTFATTLIFGGAAGILTGIAFSLGLFIWRSSRPHAAELGLLEGEGVFRNVKRFPEARRFPRGLILRVDAPLYFANTKFLEDLIHQNLVERPEAKWVILDCSGVNDMDAVAIDALEEIMDAYRGKVRFLFAEMRGPVRDLVERAGWEERYGPRLQFPSIQQALKEMEEAKHFPRPEIGRHPNQEGGERC
ncbi:MAG: solute carrier family 26 protein [Desulfobacterota bacterium]|nr:solute carrier family 26 protein [Thermodesulfobacteriota bacterium]